MVLDTDVVVAALRSPGGASAALLRRARRGRVTLLMTLTLAMEYEAVQARSEHRRAANLSRHDVSVYLNGLIALAEPVAVHFLWRPQLRDPDDEMVLEAAVNGRADALVTFNRRDFGTAPRRFGIEVLEPRQALARIDR